MSRGSHHWEVLHPCVALEKRGGGGGGRRRKEEEGEREKKGERRELKVKPRTVPNLQVGSLHMIPKPHT